jgi:hypothetical protein
LMQAVENLNRIMLKRTEKNNGDHGKIISNIW